MKNDKLFDLKIYIVKLKYTITTPPFKMEIRIVYTKVDVCKDIKNHELQNLFQVFNMGRRNHFRIFLSLAVNCEKKVLKVYFVPNF